MSHNASNATTLMPPCAKPAGENADFDRLIGRSAGLSFCVIFFLLFFAVFCVALKVLLGVNEAVKQKRSRWLRRVTLCSVLTMAFFRMLWLLDPWRIDLGLAGSHVYSSVFRGLLIPAGQVPVLCSITLVMLLWRQVVTDSTKLRRSKSRRHTNVRMTDSDRYTLYLGASMGTILFSLQIVGALHSSSESNVFYAAYRGLIALYVIGMTTGGVFYSVKLRRLMATLDTERARLKIKIVLQMVSILVFASTLGLTAVVFRSFFINLEACDEKSRTAANVQYLVYIWMVHTTEVLGCLSVGLTASPRGFSRRGAVGPTLQTTERTRTLTTTSGTLVPTASPGTKPTQNAVNVLDGPRRQSGDGSTIAATDGDVGGEGETTAIELGQETTDNNDSDHAPLCATRRPTLDP